MDLTSQISDNTVSNTIYRVKSFNFFEWRVTNASERQQWYCKNNGVETRGCREEALKAKKNKTLVECHCVESLALCHCIIYVYVVVVLIRSHRIYALPAALLTSDLCVDFAAVESGCNPTLGPSRCHKNSFFMHRKKPTENTLHKKAFQF